jgi:hypothetical protein
MTAMDGGNAIGLPGATLAHCNEIIIFNKLLIDRTVAVPMLLSATHVLCNVILAEGDVVLH